MNPPTPGTNPAATAPAAPPISAPEPAPPSAWHRWTTFWFTPADPTTLGFIRICTGLLVLYIHLAYSLDLQAFFGKHGWYASAFVEKERTESPYLIPSFWGGWQDNVVPPQLSNFPHRRQAFMEFLRGLPTDPVERSQALAYLNRANGLSPDDFRFAMFYVQKMGTRPAELENSLTVLQGGQLEDPTVTRRYERDTPTVFLGLTKEEKTQIASEVRAFWTMLGKIKWSETPGRDYVFNHLNETNPEVRKALIDFINSLPAGDSPEDVKERKRLLDYLEYWNSDPRLAHRLGSGIFSIWFHVTDPTEMALIHSGILVLIVLFTFGLFTPVTSVLVWIATISYIHRTQQVLFGMDTMMNILLFYLMIGNCGAALSVDRLIARYRAARASLARSGGIDLNTRAFLASPPPSMSAGFAMRLIQVHFCFIYVAAGLSKLKGPAWWTGQAFWDVVVNPEFTLLQHQWYQKLIALWAGVKPLYYFTITTGVWVTLFVEIAGPFLLWTRLRWLTILLATAMHAVIAVLMGLNLFELLMIIMLLAFFPDRVIRDRFRGGPDLRRLGYSFNPQKPAHQSAAAFALALDVDNQIALQPDRNTRAPLVVDADGKSSAGSPGVVSLFNNVRFLSILGFVLWIPGMKTLLAKQLFPKDAAPTGGPTTTGKPPVAAAR